MALSVCCVKSPCCLGTHVKQSVSKGLGTSGLVFVVLLLCSSEKYALGIDFPGPASTSWCQQP